VLARRQGDKWYVAGINAQKETVQLKVNLPMIEGGEQIQFYRDDAQLNGQVASVKMGKKQEIDLEIPGNGGVVLVN
jgi:hypothetical protein